MTVEINGLSINVANGCNTLTQLLTHEGFSGIGQAVAVDNKVVPRTEWDATPLHDGMKITVIRAVCGG